LDEVGYILRKEINLMAQKRENFLRPLCGQKPAPKPAHGLGNLHFAYYVME
jgi:hypothetical protein